MFIIDVLKNAFILKHPVGYVSASVSPKTLRDLIFAIKRINKLFHISMNIEDSVMSYEGLQFFLMFMDILNL